MRKSFSFVVLALIALSSSAQLLWKVSGNGLEKPSYVFGTVHVASASMIDKIPGLEQALESCDIVVGEVKNEEMKSQDFQMTMAQVMLAPPDSTLDKLFTSEEYAIIEQEFNKPLGVMGFPMSVTLSQMNALKPNIITRQIQALRAIQALQDVKDLPDLTGLLDLSEMDMNINVMIDMAIQDRANEMGRPSVGLESIEEQTDLLWNAPLTKQAKNLLDVCRNSEPSRLQSLELLKAYINQDLTKIQEIISDPEIGSLFGRTIDEFIFDRNRNWVEKLDKTMPEHSCLVCVGAGHLPGDQGLLQLLRNRGYTVEPMQ